MSTTEEKVLYQDGKIAGLARRIDTLNPEEISDRLENLETERDASKFQDDHLADRLDAVERCMKQYTKLEGSRLTAYEDLDDKANTLAVRVMELERPALFFDGLIDKQYEMLATQDARIEELERLADIQREMLGILGLVAGLLKYPARERDDADDGRVINFDPDARSNFDNPSTLLHVKDGRVDVTEAHT